MQIVGIIPARYASTRFPAKPLADIGGKSMIQRVYEQSAKCRKLSKVIVATDDDRIFEAVKRFGGNVCMTNAYHQSGTDRCYQAYKDLQITFDYVINIQGDEPFINPKQIDLLAGLLDGKTELGTLVQKINSEKELFDPNLVKVVFNNLNEAIYFSRAAIPYNRSEQKSEWLNHHPYFKHIGIYAYRTDILKRITEIPVGSLEKTESLEQLRWLQHGFKIKVAETDYPSIGVDTPEDLEKLKNFY